ncbi:hypothetical protein V490_00080, partial [Pseudogymnoascus sp. VKM F-3557]
MIVKPFVARVWAETLPEALSHPLGNKVLCLRHHESHIHVGGPPRGNDQELAVALSPTLDKLQQPLRGYKRRSDSRSASGMLEVGDEVSPPKRSSSFVLCTKPGPIQGEASACGETRTPNYGTVQLLGKQIYMVKLAMRGDFGGDSMEQYGWLMYAMRPLPNNIAKMEQQLAELQRKYAEEQQKTKQAEARADAAEAESQPKNLIEYLETCHSFSLALKVITDKSLSTRGDTTVPTGRPYPQRIVPWGDFPAQQEKIWEKLSISPDFNSQRVFPSAHQLDYVRKYLDPIASEAALRHFARDTVENP